MMACGAATAQAQTLLPAPQEMTMGKGYFSLTKPYDVKRETTVQTDNVFLTPFLSKAVAGAKRVVILRSGRTANREAYSLHITPDTIVVVADNKLGFLRAGQTLQQWQRDSRLRSCDIADEPQYQWRGYMMDFSRHFFDADFVKRQIDILASYKINVLHMHLVDGVGWRLVIDRYPRLTSYGAWRKRQPDGKWWQAPVEFLEEGTPGAYGGYFTKQQLRDIVKYAEERGITCVPEIEMPGHNDEVTACYPELACRQPEGEATRKLPTSTELCPGNEGVYSFLENVLDEVFDIFPSKYIHVGGDEAGKGAWHTCPVCQRKAKELGLSNTDDLQAYLISRMSRFIASRGHKLIGWDEIISDSLNTDEAVMVWRDINHSRKAISRGCDVVLTPTSNCYLDYHQDDPSNLPQAVGPYLPLEQVYALCPESVLTPDEMQHVLGVQGNMWTEWIATPEYAEFMTYPRILAIAELGWTGTAKKDYKDFRKRAIVQVDKLKAAGHNPFDLRHEVGEPRKKK